jgi:hypothetical protein
MNPTNSTNNYIVAIVLDERLIYSLDMEHTNSILENAGSCELRDERKLPKLYTVTN